MPDNNVPDDYALESFDWSNVEKAVKILEAQDQKRKPVVPADAQEIVEQRLQLLIEHYASPALLRGDERDAPGDVAANILAFLAALEAE